LTQVEVNSVANDVYVTKYPRRLLFSLYHGKW